MSTADPDGEAPLLAAAAAAITAPADVTSLDEARARRSRRARLGAALGAAAVVLVGFVAVGSALRDRDHASQSEAGSAVAASDEAAAETKVAPAETVASAAAGAVPDHSTATNDQAQNGGDAATETTSAAATGSTVAQGALPVPALGPSSPAASVTAPDIASQQAAPALALATTDDLRRFVADHGQLDASALAAPCDGRFGPALADVTWRGVPAVVVVQPNTSAPVRAVVVDADCGVLASIDLP